MGGFNMPVVSQVNNLKNLVDELNKSNYILWNGDEPLDEVLSQLSSYEIDPSAKLQANIARNINFLSSAKLYIKEHSLEQYHGDFESLYDMLKYINEKLPDLFKTKFENVSVLINSNDSKEVIDTIQQFANLKLHPNVWTDEEKVLYATIDNFDKEYENLKSKLLSNIEKIEKYDDIEYESVDGLKKDILIRLGKIKEILETTKDRSIKVAVFATKKTGKSMVIDGILEEEYAPTSLELATPTVIEYVPHDSNKIILIENGRVIFESENVKEVRKYLKEKFEKVNKAGKLLPEIMVKYPKRNRFVEYTVYDTPGPDLAGSEHGKVIETYLEKSDVALFIMDYSKYAQEEEIKLLEKVIKEYKEKKKKKLSLIVAVNKIDLMYSDQDLEKMQTRVAEFIREKLKVLDIDELVVIPISAMYYFYALTMEKMLPEAREDLEKLDESEKTEIHENKSYLSTLDTAKSVLKRHYGVRERIGTKHVKELSNFETFFKYADFIAKVKALPEKLKGLFYQVDSTIKLGVNNTLELLKLVEKDKEQVEKVFEEYKKQVRDIEVVIDVNYKEYEESLNKKKEEVKKKLVENLKQLYKALEKEIIDKSNDLENGVIELIDKQNFSTYFEEQATVRIVRFKEEINNVLLEKLKKQAQSLYNDIIEELKSHVKRQTDDLKNKLKEILEKIKESTYELENKIKLEFGISINLELPAFVAEPSLGEFEALFEKNLEDLTVSTESSLEKINNSIGKIYGDDFLKDFVRVFDFFGTFTSQWAEDSKERFRDKFENVKKDLKLGIGNIMTLVQNDLLENFDNFVNFSILLSENKRKIDEFMEGLKSITGFVEEKSSKSLDEKREIIEFSKQVLGILSEPKEGFLSLWKEVVPIFEKQKN